MTDDVEQQAAIIVWLRRDLRLADNPALYHAASSGSPVVPLYIWSPDEEGQLACGSASRWWLDRSLASFAEQLKAMKIELTIRAGDVLSTVRQVVSETGARAVYWNRSYEPHSIVRERNLKGALAASGIDGQSFNGSLLYEPWQVLNTRNEPYRVFTSFWKAKDALGEPEVPLPSPRSIKAARKVDSLPIEELSLLTDRGRVASMCDSWTPGEPAALKALDLFIKNQLHSYEDDRNRPFLAGTSRLSPFISFGEISPRTIWHALAHTRYNGAGRSTFLKELCWREFAYHLLYHFPSTLERPLQAKFDLFPSSSDERLFEIWCKGNTGYPIVDAGMRELYTTGWMHNRVRMVVASFLVKDLLIPWQDGAGWFWDALVDADPASNTLGWQWAAGCGADAAPFFRIFNPVLQSEKFDPEGNYLRKWVPELKRLSNKWVHKPWEAPVSELTQAGIKLGETYPLPVVDHSMARERALHAFKTISHGDGSERE